jgi:WD40 repeat protein
MSTRWYVRVSGKEHGPYSSAQLKQLAQKGRISPATPVRREQDTDWTTAARIKGLLDSPQQATVPPSTDTHQAVAPVQASSPVPKWLWGLIGAALLVLVGAAVLIVITSRHGAAERRAEAANKSLAEAVAEAKSSLEKRDFDSAERSIRAALADEYATETDTAQAMLRQIAKAREETQANELLAAAESNIRSGDVDAAIQSLQQVANLSAATTDVRRKAAKLLSEAELATSPQKATEAVLKLSKTQFDALVASGELPADLEFEQPVLEKSFQAMFREIRGDIERARQKEFNRSLAASMAKRRRGEIGREHLKLDDFDRRVNTVGVSILHSRGTIACPFPDKNTVHLWNPRSGHSVGDLVPPGGFALDDFPSTAFSPDLRHVAATVEAAKDGARAAPRIGLWHLTFTEFVRYFDGVDNRPAGFDSFGPIQLTLANLLAAATYREPGREQHVVRVWDYKTGELVRSFEGHQQRINALAVSADGRFAATGGDDRLAILWEIDSGREVRSFEGHEGSIRAIAFSPDGETLLTGGFDCTVRLWDVTTGEAQFTWKLGTHDARAAASGDVALARDDAEVFRDHAAGGTTSALSSESWPHPFVTSVDFAPLGDRAVVGLRVVDPESLSYYSNPVLINLSTNFVVELPEVFNARPRSRVWAAFSHDGNDVIFNTVRSEGFPGREETIPYFSVTGVP